MGKPTASVAGRPQSVSAAALRYVTCPSASVVMTPSEMESSVTPRNSFSCASASSAILSAWMSAWKPSARSSRPSAAKKSMPLACTQRYVPSLWRIRSVWLKERRLSPNERSVWAAIIPARSSGWTRSIQVLCVSGNSSGR